ncbi:MAG TPA: MarR family winged helix-turn-helix transcriptional regulator [Candidatus Kapabacteria bacterium]|nr:MarR family winged helix-turn-helix transcriptional regulator [Candidatus Kapabacteria bacterium]
MADTDLSEILDALRTLVHALQAGSRSSEERVGLTGAQLFVLEKLHAVDSMTVNELAAATHTRQSTVSVVVSKLVKKGMVLRVRSTEDARIQKLSITRRGKSKLERAPETVQDRLVQTLKKMPRMSRIKLAWGLEYLIVESGLAGIKAEFFLENNRKSDERRIK